MAVTNVLSAGEALKLINPNMRIVTAMAAAEPKLFYQNVMSRVNVFENVRVYCANPSEQYPVFQPNSALEGKLELLVMFLTSKVRDYQGYNRIHYIPQHLSRWVHNILAEGPIDIFWGSCSMPDERGFVSLGLSCCYESEIFRHARIRILEMNPNMPVTFGGTSVSLKEVTHFIESKASLPSAEFTAMGDLDLQVAQHVAALVEDGSTVQLGIGSIPNAIGKLLRDKKDLGVHTEMINDAMMNLYEAGVITNRFKTIWPGKMVGGFVFGSQELYRFADNNPVIELQPASVVNDPYRIGRNYKMVSINTAVEVDLTGQVCSESVGHRELSGVGGASETHIGAQRSNGGRGVVALHSMAKNGESKIAFELKPGAKVSISRNDVDTVVTEHGFAKLSGKSVSDRVKAMVGIAHPSVREDLMFKARQGGYI